MKTIFALMFVHVAILAMAQSNVRIIYANPTTHEVWLKNFGNVSQNVATHFLCNFPDYRQIGTLVSVGGSTNIAAGATLKVIFPEMNGADGECGYYINNTNFGAVANMRDYMEWGSAGHFRETVAVSGGYWCTGEFVSGDPAYNFTGGGSDHCVAFWSSELGGCIYEAAINYNPSATFDNGSCVFEPSSCPGDLDNNGFINTSDLLAFMAIFGTNC